MNLLQEFEIAYGTTQGVRHKQTHKNNQDAYTFRKTQSRIVGVVSDGCGSTPYAEVGSRLIAELVAECVIKKMSFDDIQTQIISMMNQVSLSYHNPRQMLSGLFSATIVGFCLDQDYLTTFSFGDGIIIENNLTTYHQEFEKNAPPYIVYKLIGSTMFDQSDLHFVIHSQTPIAEVQNCLVGTDGIADLISSSQFQKPGKNELVGDVSQFWSNDMFYHNDSYLQAYLCQLATDVYKTNARLLSEIGQTGRLSDLNRVGELFQKYPGILPDDTTMVVLRRKKQ